MNKNLGAKVVSKSIDYLLKPLSAEELKKVEPISVKEIEKALNKGMKEAEMYRKVCYAKKGFYF